MMRHRDAWAEENHAPSQAAWQQEQKEAMENNENNNESAAAEGEVLVVVSKVKKYIRDRAGMNTSDGVAAVLSNRVRQLCDEAVAEAKNAGRKTVMDRDVK
jgi:histone H3/H4